MEEVDQLLWNLEEVRLVSYLGSYHKRTSLLILVFERCHNYAISNYGPLKKHTDRYQEGILDLDFQELCFMEDLHMKQGEVQCQLEKKLVGYFSRSNPVLLVFCYILSILGLGICGSGFPFTATVQVSGNFDDSRLHP